MNQIVRANAPDRLPPAPGRRHRRARSGSFGVLDIGSTKIVCLVARIESDGAPRVLGFGWQRARGIKGGNIVDMEAAEEAIRAAVGQAESMSDTRLSGVIVNLSCGQPDSRISDLRWPIGGRAITEADIRAVRAHGRRRASEDGRETVHAVPLGFQLDATGGVNDPRGMICDSLGAKFHLVGAASASLRNLGACLLRCDLEVEELVSSPFAAALSTLVPDERELGATVIDMGGGTTSIAVVQEDHLLHTAQIPVGGWQVTNDIARGLATPIAQAERLKTLHGSVMSSPDDEREQLTVPQVGEEEEQLVRIPKAMLVNIIRPRIEETLELVRDRLDHAALGPDVGARIVLTGGASQITGVRELATDILKRPVRLGRPHAVRGLPEHAQQAGFAATLGLLAWGAGDGRPPLDIPDGPESRSGLFQRLVRWLRDRV